MRALRVSSQSTAEPIEVSQVKTHLNIFTTADDTALDWYITAARQVAENKTKRALVDTQWVLTLDSFASSHIDLPRPPLSTNTTEVVIEYTKTTGDTTTLPSTVYTVEHRAEPGFIRLNYESEWPTDVQDSEGAVRITYRSGYTTATVPRAIKQWISMRVGQMYEYREPLIDITAKELPRDYVDGLLDPYTVITI